jgi:tRNA A-37 threonylcarbamoyl transferase component Bud32
MRPGGPKSLLGMTLSGRYRIEKLLGEGGMGAVYQAEHTHMRKRLAVKVLHPEMSRMPEVVARFEREAMAAAHIDHPNVAGATDFGKLDDGSFFLVLEYVEGKSLRDLIGGGRLELGRALHIMRQIASALGRAHALGIVHRDLKPENVMLIEREGDHDFAKVLDFGIAKVPVGEISQTQSMAGQPALTQLGMVYGTPEYMAPEQALGQPVDPRADIYSLGVITFEMLTGVRPFEHESKVTLLGMHVTAPIPRMADKAKDAQVPAEVEAIVARMLAKDVANRFADARELIEAIGAAMANLVAAGRIDVVVLDRAIASTSALSTGVLGPASLRGSRASMPGISGPRGSLPFAQAKTAVALRFRTLGHETLLRARTLASRVSMRTWAIGGGAAGALVFLVLFITVLSGNRDGSAKGTAAPDASSQVATKPEKPARDHKLDDTIAEAEGSLEASNYAAAIAQLTPLEQAHGDRADIHRDLERAYMATGEVKSAMLEAELWLQADPAAAADPRLGTDVHSAALGRDDPDPAFALLETRMGSAGTDILYDLAYGSAPRSAQSKARASLGIPDVRAHASPALAVTLDLRATSSCESKHAHLARAREVGDARTLSLLRGYTATSGCGFLGTRDCFACMHHDGSLAAAIEAVESRLATK